MAKATANPKSWKDRLRAELGRDKKKTAVLGLLLAVAGIVAGRLAITHAVPDRASGAEALAVVAPPPGGDEDDAQRDPPGRRHAADHARRTAYLARLDRTVTRDLFRPNLEYFPRLPGTEDPADAGPADPGWFGDVHRRIVEKQRAGSDELARIRAVRAQARELSLQSTMLGSRPTALINGQVLRTGDGINGFRVKRIASDRCVVSKGGVDVELRME